MYIIVDNTNGITLTHKGDWPSNWLAEQADKGIDLIIISLYSNTVKVIDKIDENYDGKTYVFKEYHISEALDFIKIYDVLNKNLNNK